MNILDRAIAAFSHNALVKRATLGLAQLTAFIRSSAQQVLAAIDLRDVFTFSGLGAIFFGLSQIYSPVAWVVVGIALFWLGVRR